MKPRIKIKSKKQKAKNVNKQANNTDNEEVFSYTG